MNCSHTQLSNVTVDEAKKTVHVLFTPTVPHCSASTLIGLSIRYKPLSEKFSRNEGATGVTRE